MKEKSSVQEQAPEMETVSVKDQLKEIKTQLAEAKSELRKFKVANKIKDIEAIEDPEIMAQAEELTTKVDLLTEEKEALLEQAKTSKGSGKGGGSKYGYNQVIDPVTGEPRDMTKEEKKKWRTHARKVAKKEGLAGPEEVPMDPNFLVKPKKEKKEKPAKGKKGKSEEETADGDALEKGLAEAPVKKSKKVKREKVTTDEDDD